MARAHARITSLPPRPCAAPAGQVRVLRPAPLPDPNLGPGAPAAWRLPARRRGAPRLDGSVRRDARAARGAPGVVPRQRAVHVHVAQPRAVRPQGGWPAAGVARRRDDRPARRVGAGRGRQRRRLRPDARRHRERSRRYDRAVQDRLGRDRPADRRTDRADRDCRHRGAVRRPADGVAGAPRRGPSATSFRTGTASCPLRARARSSTWRAG